MDWGALASVGSSLLGGIFGSSGQRSANAANLKIAKEQMDFQERMSSTAHRRAAFDLEKAGLNRILALGKPASTPQGASAVMQNEKHELGMAVKEAALLAAQIDNIRANTAKTMAEKENVQQSNTINSPWEKVMDKTGQFLDEAEEMARSSAKSVSGTIKNAQKWFNENRRDPKTRLIKPSKKSGGNKSGTTNKPLTININKPGTNSVSQQVANKLVKENGKRYMIETVKASDGKTYRLLADLKTGKYVSIRRK
jgi:hypothetical protein